MKTERLTTSKQDIEKAGRIIRNGGLVAFPTETVYGLGADALNAQAVQSIFEAKGRPGDNPLIVHIAEQADIVPLVAEVTPQAQALIEAFFPAPLTIVLKKSACVPPVTSGGLDTVAVRMPENETARALIKASGCPIAAPSANTSGLPSPTKAQYVIEDMNGKIDAVIDGGDCRYGVESTVITLAEETPTILRPGAITKEMIEQVIGKVAIAPSVLEGLRENETAASPGMKYQHYAPRAKIMLVKADKARYEAFVNEKTDAFALCFEGDAVAIPHVVYGREQDDISQAQALFTALRRLDEMGAQKVYARLPRQSGVGLAVYNRLIRAAAFRIIDLEKPFTIGLTGPTGAGKGYVCAQLKTLGFRIINSDAYARELTQKDAPLLPALAAAFGQDILENGVLNRALLAERAFASQEQTEKLNRLMHPAIMARCKEAAAGLCVLDAPQLFEAQAQQDCYKVISVTAPLAVRLQRITERDNISEKQALLRMHAQFSEEYYTNHSDYVIINDGKCDVMPQIQKILEEIL